MAERAHFEDQFFELAVLGDGLTKGLGLHRRGKRLKAFNVLGSVAGSPGQLRAWASGDASAHVIYNATFTDGSTAIMTTAVP